MATSFKLYFSLALLLFICLISHHPQARAAICVYGPDQCLYGYVWREAFPGDHRCVTGASRAQARDDNAHAEERHLPGSEECVFGYVWREASSSDHVCVSGTVRAQTASENDPANDKVETGCKKAQCNANCLRQQGYCLQPIDQDGLPPIRPSRVDRNACFHERMQCLHGCAQLP